MRSKNSSDPTPINQIIKIIEESKNLLNSIQNQPSSKFQIISNLEKIQNSLNLLSFPESLQIENSELKSRLLLKESECAKFKEDLDKLKNKSGHTITVFFTIYNFIKGTKELCKSA